MIDPAPGDGSERVGRTDRPSVASSIPSSLASLQPDNELRVSTLELFFDLVFVLTITQLAAQLSNQPSPTGALRVCLIFIVVFWMHAGYVLLTNQVPPVSITRRLLLIGGMAGFFVCAVASPRGSADAGLVFGIGYLILVLVHAGLYAQVHARAVLRFAPFNLAGAAWLIAASLVHGGTRRCTLGGTDCLAVHRVLPCAISGCGQACATRL